MLGKGSISGLVVWRDRLFATGCVPDGASDCGQRIIVTSADGETWDANEVDITVNGDLGFGRLHRVGGRLFALGYADGRSFGGAIVLTSLDGRSWSRIRSPSFAGRSVQDIIKTPLGTFAIGYNAPPGSDATSGFLIWPVGADDSFGAVRVADPGRELAIVTGVMWTGDELLAWGPRHHPMGGRGPMVLLGSPDGRTWTERAAISAGKRAWISDIAVAHDRLVAVGYEGRRFPLTPRAWTSEDAGRNWTLAEVPGDDEAIATVDAFDTGLVARGIHGWDSTRRVVSWASPDGLEWVRLPDDDDLPLVPGFGGNLPVSMGERTCVAGGFYYDMPIAAAIYCR